VAEERDRPDQDVASTVEIMVTMDVLDPVSRPDTVHTDLVATTPMGVGSSVRLLVKHCS